MCFLVDIAVHLGAKDGIGAPWVVPRRAPMEAIGVIYGSGARQYIE